MDNPAVNTFIRTNAGFVKKININTGRRVRKVYKVRNILGKMLRIKHWFFGFHFIAIKDKRIFRSPIYDGKVYISDVKVPSISIPLLSVRLKSTNYRLHVVVFGFSATRLSNLPIHNPIKISYSVNANVRIQLPLKFNWLTYTATKLQFIGPIWINRKSNRSFYIRTSVDGRYFFTVREVNATDSFLERIKILIGFVLAIIAKPFVQRTTFLYEKKCDRYEESASVLYEGMLDKGITNTKYILNEDKIDHVVPSHYKSCIIRRHTVKHYYHFFNAGVFIATEAPGHSIDLRIANFLAVNKLLRKNYKFVHLQHGVMYMVSLGSQARKAFRHGGVYPDDVKIVVSSTEEAKHFIEEGGYSASNLYVTGLPKFDRLEWNNGANDIVIMPTWRPWEYNEISQNCQASGYYKMISEILESIPKELLHNVRILPHPLFLSSFNKSPLSDFIVYDKTYDEIMRDTAVLITDYSSIAYDIYARGGKVIFWWKEKDYCMEQYKGTLKLTERKCFGDVVYDQEELRAALTKALVSKVRCDTELAKFREIVFDFNGGSTNKLIERLLEDGYIK